MTRTVSLASLILLFGLSALGCNNNSTATTQTNVPIESSEGASKKGHKTNSMEAGVSDPYAKKK